MADKWRNVEHRQRKKVDFLNNYGKLYGYGGAVDKMQEQEFARLKGMVYLDHTGTTHYAQSQLESYMQDLQTHVYGNPHTRSASSRLTTDTIDQLRFRILQHFNTSVEHHNIIFTSGCTGALKLLAESFPWEDGSIFSYLEDNHTSVLGVREIAAKERATIMFGFPTGLGALIVRKDAEDALRKTYFGGGTALAVTSNERFYVPRPNLHDRFEDGTLPFLDIIALRHGFDTLENLTGGMQYISQHTFSLAQYVYLQLTSLKHHNGQPVTVVYTDTQFDDITTQGGIVNFNLLRANGNFVGYSEVDKLAALHDIHVRTGCFCNSGACRRHLGLSDGQLRQNYQAGHVCGDDKDLISGRPTGSVRISFGYMSTFEDAQFFLNFVQECFVEKSPKTTTGAGNAQNEQCLNTGLTSKLNVQIANEGLDVEYDKTETKRSATLQSSGLKHASKNQADDPQESCRDSLKKEFVIEETSKRQDDKEKPTENSEAKVPGQRHLTNIFLYPVKSCGAFEVKSWQLSARGLMYDREWMVVNESGVCLSQKREPKLCLIRPAIYLTKGVLQLSAEGMKPLNVPLTGAKMGDMEASMCQSKVCGDRITGLDCGNEAADWLTRFLGRPCRLVRQNPDSDRDCKVNRDGDNSADGKFSLSLANESQYLLISRQSVRELQQKINTNSNMVIPTEDLVLRFRGNLVIDSGQPYEEDDWSELMIGQHQFQSRGQCSRCQMVCLDQATTERSKEPLMTLLRIRGKKVPFGIHLVHNMADTESCCIQVGDKVTPITMATD
ncbi:hypothetical protein Bbelb_265260 [Branchiostoma belcheri]|nr:hypothetical protein Bbelb_265260 [Branchiostoma belcheri]